MKKKRSKQGEGRGGGHRKGRGWVSAEDVQKQQEAFRGQERLWQLSDGQRTNDSQLARRDGGAICEVEVEVGY